MELMWVEAILIITKLRLHIYLLQSQLDELKWRKGNKIRACFWKDRMRAHDLTNSE